MDSVPISQHSVGQKVANPFFSIFISNSLLLRDQVRRAHFHPPRFCACNSRAVSFWDLKSLYSVLMMPSACQRSTILLAYLCLCLPFILSRSASFAGVHSPSSSSRLTTQSFRCHFQWIKVWACSALNLQTLDLGISCALVGDLKVYLPTSKPLLILTQKRCASLIDTCIARIVRIIVI